MVELIFAIVVMGIVLMSLPNIVSISSRSTYTALQQESVAEAASTLALMMTHDWDENAKDGVIKTDSTVITSCTPPRPIGVTDTLGRPCIDANASTSLGTDTGEPANSPLDYDDVDDFISGPRVVSVPAGEGSYATWKGDIIDKEINVTITVTYGRDAAPSTTNYPNPFNGTLTGTTNIKLLSVYLKTSNSAEELNTKEIRLSAFVCNIGKPASIKERDY